MYAVESLRIISTNKSESKNMSQGITPLSLFQPKAR